MHARIELTPAAALDDDQQKHAPPRARLLLFNDAGVSHVFSDLALTGQVVADYDRWLERHALAARTRASYRRWVRELVREQLAAGDVAPRAAVAASPLARDR